MASHHLYIDLRCSRIPGISAQVGDEYSYYGQPYTYTQGSPAEIQTSIHWNLIGRRMTAPPHVIAQQYSSATLVSRRFDSRK